MMNDVLFLLKSHSVLTYQHRFSEFFDYKGKKSDKKVNFKIYFKIYVTNRFI